MGNNTYALLTDPPSLEDLLRYFNKSYSRANMTVGGEDWWNINFMDGEDQRNLAVFPPNVCSGDYRDVCTTPAILISMNCWGNSEVIARRVAIKFGGLIKVNDAASDDWVTP